MIKIDPELALQVSTHFNYLEAMQLSGQFYSTAMDDNSGQRVLEEKRYAPQELQMILAHLQVDKNKLLILKLMKPSDLIYLMQFMDKELLLLGFKFFPKSKLMQFISRLPWELIVKMLLTIFPVEELMSYLPTEQLLRILKSSTLDERALITGLQYFPKEVLQMIMSKITGQPMDNINHRELLNMFFQLKKFQIIEGLTILPYKQLMGFVYFFTRKDPKLFEMLSRDFVFRMFDRVAKNTLIESFRILPENILIRFLSQLPHHMLAQVVSLMDTKALEYLMMTRFKGLLASLAA